MLYDDDTRRPPNDDIDPFNPEPVDVSRVSRKAKRRIAELQRDRTWNAIDVFAQMRAEGFDISYEQVCTITTSR